MSPINFCYWLQGYFELRKPEISFGHDVENPRVEEDRLDSVQVQKIKDHLDLVFNKMTPKRTFAYGNSPSPMSNIPITCGIAIDPGWYENTFKKEQEELNKELREQPPYVDMNDDFGGPNWPEVRYLDDNDPPVSC